MIITTATGALRVALTASAAEKVVEEETAFSCSRAKVVSHRRRRHHRRSRRRLRRSGGEEQATERPKQNQPNAHRVLCVLRACPTPTQNTVRSCSAASAASGSFSVVIVY